MLENHIAVGNADHDAEYLPGELKVIEAVAADELADPDYWHGLEIDSETALRLAYAMQNLDRSINGDALAVQAVLGALSRIQTHHVQVIVEDER